jgi:hypothetical protein
MVVVLVVDKMELRVVLVVLAAAELVEDPHRELLVDLQLKHHLVVELDMGLLVEMDKLDLLIEVEVEVVLVLLEVQDQHKVEMVLVDMEYRHHHHLEIL